MVWTNGLALSDLLATIPGVYIARAGFVGQPEFAMYGGRGSAGVELYWDGIPFNPLGDSVYTDVARISLSYLRKVDVEITPGALRVYLFSEEHERAEPRSVLRITSGAFSTAQYAGLFQWRWPSGIGLNLAADYLASDGDPNASRNDSYFDLWTKLQWTASDGSTGAVYQTRRQNHDRDARAGDGSSGVPFRKGKRTDALFKIYGGTRPDRLGVRAEAGVSQSSWGEDSIIGDQSIRQAFGRFRYSRPNLSFEGIGRVADARVRSELEARVGWVPLSGITFSFYARHQGFQGNRTANSGGASVGIYRGPFWISAQATRGNVVAAPAIIADTGQTIEDASVRLGVDMRVLAGSVGLVKRDAFQPRGIADFPDLPSMDSSAAATYIVVDATLRPVYPLSITAWYSHPRTIPGDLQPPKHMRGDVTFRSKFWRTFRSGVFDLLLRWSLESWGDGTAGLNGSGSAVLLPAASFQEWFIQIQLVGFKVFWNLRNAANTADQYVPTLVYPRNAQIFGVKWEFTN